MMQTAFGSRCARDAGREDLPIRPFGGLTSHSCFVRGRRLHQRCHAAVARSGRREEFAKVNRNAFLGAPIRARPCQEYAETLK
jgi:hypothetical protein